jgi:hypothetical protein
VRSKVISGVLVHAKGALAMDVTITRTCKISSSRLRSWQRSCYEMLRRPKQPVEAALKIKDLMSAEEIESTLKRKFKNMQAKG